jgi:Ca2+-binding EF-hand superfamily protein
MHISTKLLIKVAIFCVICLTIVHSQEEDIMDKLMLKGVDANSDGEISYPEFKDFVSGLPNIKEHYKQ